MVKTKSLPIYILALALAVTLPASVDAALDLKDNEKNKVEFDRPIDLLEAIPLKQLPIGQSVASSVTVLNGRLYILYDNITELGVFDSNSFAQLANIRLFFPNIKPSIEDVPDNPVLQNNVAKTKSNYNLTDDQFSNTSSIANSTDNNSSSANFSRDVHPKANASFDGHLNESIAYDNRTETYLAHANISDDKFIWDREIFSCPKTKNLLVSVKNSERGIRIWKLGLQASDTLWLMEPMLESGLKDAIVTGTGCAIIILRTYENDYFTLTRYSTNGTADLVIMIRPSETYADQEDVFPVQAFETKWGTILLIFGSSSHHLAIEINQKGDVLRTLPRDADKRNLAAVNYVILSTIDVHSTLFVVDGKADTVAAIDEDLSHSRLVLKSNSTRTCIYADYLSGQLFLCNSASGGSSIDIYNVIYHDDDRKPNNVAPGQGKI